MKRILFLASLLVGLALAFAPIEAPRVAAQTFPGQTSPGYIPIGQGTAQIKWLPVSGCTLTSPGALSCPPASLSPNVQTGNYSAQPTDCSARVAFNVTSLSTFTLGAPSGFASVCDIVVSNIGQYTGPSSARGVILSVSGLTFPNQANVIYPGQVTAFSKIGGVWVETGYDWRKLWKPSASPTFFVDCSAGSDTTADGLGTTTGANATVAQSYVRLSNFVDYSGGAVKATISGTGSCPNGDILHIAGPLRGAQGNAALTLNGNSGSLTINTTAGNPCTATFDGGWVEVNGVTCQPGSGAVGNADCFDTNSNSQTFFIGVVSTCLPLGSGQGVAATGNGARVEFINVGLNFGTSGGGSYGSFLFATDGGQITFDGAMSLSLQGNATFSLATVYMQRGAKLALNGTTFALNGHTVTASPGLYLDGGSQAEIGAVTIPGTGQSVLGGSGINGANPLIASAGGSACGSNQVPVGNGATTAPTCEAVPNAALANASTTVNNQTCTLGSTCSVLGGSSGQIQFNSGGTSFGGVSGCTSNGTTIGCASSDLLINGSSTGTTAIASANSGASNFTVTIPAVTDTFAMLAAAQTLTNKTINGSSNTLTNIANASLVNSSTTVAGATCTLGSSCLSTTASQLALVPSWLLIGKVTGVNFNAANTDNAISVTLPTGFTRFTQLQCFISNASTSLTSATFGLFNATGGLGTALITSGTAATVSTASDATNNNLQLATGINTNSQSYTLANFGTVYFRVQTPEGAAATADVSCFGRVLP